MGMNLHTTVRGAITTVNPDIAVTYRKSTGYTTAATGKRTPSYTDTETTAQVQALSAEELQHPDFQNQQGLKRKVYMLGNALGVSRPDVQGGDLLLFPQVTGGTVQTWLVCVVFESWSPDGSWCSLGVVLQNGN